MSNSNLVCRRCFYAVAVIAAGASLALVPGCSSDHQTGGDSSEPSSSHAEHGKSSKTGQGDSAKTGQGDSASQQHEGHGGSADAMLMVETDPKQPVAGEPASLRMMIHSADGEMVRDFETIHEKKVHLIIVREGLDEFAHIHPEIAADGNLSADFTFPVGGTYRFYADHKSAGKPQATAVAKLKVSGAAPTAPKLKANVPGQVSGDGLKAEVAIGDVKIGEPAPVSFRLTDSRDRPVEKLDPYLGARGHLVIISEDASRYVHAHPSHDEDGGAKVEFEAHFPEAGLYKGWGQFSYQGEIRTVPFVVKVE